MLKRLWLVVVTWWLAVGGTNWAVAGVYEDLGAPCVGAWRTYIGTHWDPALKRELLWAQECSQDGAVLYALDLTSGELVEEHTAPARQIGRMISLDDVLYMITYSGLNQPGNVLLRFDPRVRRIEDLGIAPTPRNRFASIIAARDGALYCGTHQQGRLFRFDIATSSWSDLGPKVPPPVHERQNVWLYLDAVLTNGALIGRVRRTPPSQVVIIDPVDGAFRREEKLEGRSWIVIEGQVVLTDGEQLELWDHELNPIGSLGVRDFAGGEAYPAASRITFVRSHDARRVLVRIGRDVLRCELKARRLTKLGRLPSSGSWRVTSRGTSAVQLERFSSEIKVADLDSGVVRSFQNPYRSQRGTQICGLTRAADGSIYGTNIIGMHIFKHVPESGTTIDLGAVGWSGAEVYNTIDFDGKIYFGTYGGGHWGVYDPARPWNPDFKTGGEARDANPRKITQLGGTTPEVVNRPFEYAIGPNRRIYIASRADYGHPGGTLVEFDPQTESVRLFRDEKRSIQTVTADEKYVYCGTSVRGGRGSGERADEATFVVHDPSNGERVFESALVPGSLAVVSARAHRANGHVYFTTDNRFLVEFDPRSFAIRERWRVRSAGTPLAGVPEDVGMLHITVATDGNVYGIAHRDLFRLEVQKRRVEYLDPPPRSGLYQIVEGRPGEFFIGAGTHLLRYLVDEPVYYR